VPVSLSACPRLPDVPGVSGPMAGLLAAMRWAPHSSWLVTSCDLPSLSVEALRWLLSTREPGVWATLPQLLPGPHLEPLLAHYDFRAHPLLEELATVGDHCPARIAGHAHVISPSPPPDLMRAWRNINTEAELRTTPATAADKLRFDTMPRE